MPGMEGRQFSLLETELGDLYPVVLDGAQPGGWGSRTPNHFELTESGRASLLTKLADTQDDNAEVWEGLPGFQWYAPVLRSKAGSEVLAVHKDAVNEFGRLPLLATRTFGAGKVLFMGTDGAWRWRKGVEDKYHYRFWGQVVRWMAYQRNMAKGETMRLYYVPDQPKMNQTVSLQANIMDRAGEPLKGGDVSAFFTAPSGTSERVQFTSVGDEWGVFTGRFTPSEPGKHDVTLACKQTGATLETTLLRAGGGGRARGPPRPAGGAGGNRAGDAGQGHRAGQARRGGAVACRAARSASLGATGPVMVPPGAGGGSRRPARAFLGGPQGDRFSMMELTSKTTILSVRTT